MPPGAPREPDSSSYGLCMTSVLVVLTLALALFKGGVVSRLRSVTPYVQPISALLLVLAGGYIIYYWWPVLAGGSNPLG